ncbi:hypothetical protein FA15DRAFT_695227 [Coprinopsis marcescibilis]|uniref:Uncharacterized protein n=1 Tax=Coprinopsis marcescibilis TaxID=230819 RepID=A0A5C3L4T9_COPMA|nr:hypothetical protein FA15DRAFT_695227 [Coprinopsis marcescibilis]
MITSQKQTVRQLNATADVLLDGLSDLDGDTRDVLDDSSSIGSTVDLESDVESESEEQFITVGPATLVTQFGQPRDKKPDRSECNAPPTTPIHSNNSKIPGITPQFPCHFTPASTSSVLRFLPKTLVPRDPFQSKPNLAPHPKRRTGRKSNLAETNTSGEKAPRPPTSALIWIQIAASAILVILGGQIPYSVYVACQARQYWWYMVLSHPSLRVIYREIRLNWNAASISLASSKWQYYQVLEKSIIPLVGPATVLGLSGIIYCDLRPGSHRSVLALTALIFALVAWTDFGGKAMIWSALTVLVQKIRIESNREIGLGITNYNIPVDSHHCQCGDQSACKCNPCMCGPDPGKAQAASESVASASLESASVNLSIFKVLSKDVMRVELCGLTGLLSEVMSTSDTDTHLSLDSNHNPLTFSMRNQATSRKERTMPWPNKIARQFQIIPEQASEQELHGPFNKLLNHLFPPDSEYTVVPRSSFAITAKNREPNPDTGKPPELGFMLFEVQYENLPVLIVLLTAPIVVDSPLAREMADAQMRSQLVSSSGEYSAADVTSSPELCPLGTLRGISAFGTKLCYFSCDTNASKPEIYPSVILRELANGLEDLAPRDRWSSDLLDREGAAQLREVVENIKAECDAESRDSAAEIN